MKYIGLSIFNWKSSCGNKNFELIAYVPGNDIFGQHTHYKLGFLCNGKVKYSYSGHRFYHDKDYYSLCNILFNHCYARDAWLAFHNEKTNIQSFKVVFV